MSPEETVFLESLDDAALGVLVAGTGRRLAELAEAAGRAWGAALLTEAKAALAEHELVLARKTIITNIIDSRRIARETEEAAQRAALEP